MNINCACELNFCVWPLSKFLWRFDFLGIRLHGVYHHAQNQNSWMWRWLCLELSEEMHTLRMIFYWGWFLRLGYTTKVGQSGLVLHRIYEIGCTLVIRKWANLVFLTQHILCRYLCSWYIHSLIDWCCSLHIYVYIYIYVYINIFNNYVDRGP